MRQRREVFTQDEAGSSELPEDYVGTGVVARVVPGSLVYVDGFSREGMLAFTPDHLRFRQEDGSLRRYRGEPFSELGISAGTQVTLGHSEGEAIVTVETQERSAPSVWSRAASLNWGSWKRFSK